MKKNKILIQNYIPAEIIRILEYNADIEIRTSFSKIVNNTNEFIRDFTTPFAYYLLEQSHKGRTKDRTRLDYAGKGPVWLLAQAGERGYHHSFKPVEECIKTLCMSLQRDEGGFSLDCSQKESTGHRTGDITRSLYLTGYRGNEFKKSIQWIIEHQRKDGGWLHDPLSSLHDALLYAFFRRSGQGLKFEGSESVISSPEATCSCAMLLSKLCHEIPEAKKCMDRAAEFFLRNRCFIDKNLEYRKLGLPLLNHYDILGGLTVIAAAGKIDDHRSDPAFNYLVSKQYPEGFWLPDSENYETLPLTKMEKKSGSHWMRLTLRVIKMLKLAEMNG